MSRQKNIEQPSGDHFFAMTSSQKKRKKLPILETAYFKKPAKGKL